MKYLTLIALVFTAPLAQADFWDNCTAYGGTIIQANKYGADQGGLCNNPSDPNLTNNCNGKRFCRGNNGMTWWSAFTWCEAIGGQLTSFENLCPGTQIINSGTCPNMKGSSSGHGWTSQGWGQDTALILNFATGGIETRTRATSKAPGGGTPMRSICEE